jgi:hypothetical protein
MTSGLATSRDLHCMPARVLTLEAFGWLDPTVGSNKITHCNKTTLEDQCRLKVVARSAICFENRCKLVNLPFAEILQGDGVGTILPY